jgi:peptidoglycan/LPS O-acetylase OafA/YrhL
VAGVHILVCNWYISHHGWIAIPVDPLWSISIEEQFYLIIPILAARGGRRAVLFAGWLLLVLAYGVVVFSIVHPEGAALWTNSFVQFQFFCVGTLIALFLRGWTLPLTLPLRVGGFLLGLVCWMASVAISTGATRTTPAFTVASWILVLVGTIVLFLSALGTPSRLVPSWVSYFGKISYGLYVFHSLVFVLLFRISGHHPIPMLTRSRGVASIYRGLEIIAALAIDLLLAHLSFVYFEGYFLRLKRRFTFVATRD